MVFSSGEFLFLFFPLLFLMYYFPWIKSIKLRKYRNYLLLLFSIGFYWWSEPYFVFLMLISIVINWWLGLWIDKNRERKKKYVVIACIYNLGLLFIFKYLGFCSENIAKLTGNDRLIVKIALPIGISFFTFQLLSYIFDVAANRARCQKNIGYLALYISMFPQLIAGPIVRYETVADEIVTRKETWEDISSGILRFVKGLAKKVILSNNLGVLTDLIFESELSGITVSAAWLGAIAYTLQIFYDFSGYSDMAIGLGKIFGFHFLENFDFPYISKSISEFWRRWHISMGTWFRDYVYIPLGGSRVGTVLLIRNLFLVWLFTGIWHGANWTFLLWGLMYFVLISWERFTEIPKKLGVFSHIYTMFFVMIGWVLFRSNNLIRAGIYLGAMFHLTGNQWIEHGTISFICQFWSFLVFGILFMFPIEKLIENNIRKKKWVGNVVYPIIMVCLFILAFLYVVKSGYNPFIYFNF